MFYGEVGMAKNLWCCMTCAEFLMEHPTNIQSFCFDHMCGDLHAENVIKRIDQNINLLESMKAEVRQISSAEKPKSIWELMKRTSMFLKASNLTKLNPFKLFKGPNPLLKVTSLQKHLMLLLMIAVLLFISFDATLSNPYESTPWLLLQSLGS